MVKLRTGNFEGATMAVLMLILVLVIALAPAVYCDSTLPYRPLRAGTKIKIYKETWYCYEWRGQGSIGIPVYKPVYVDNMHYCIYGFISAGSQGDVNNRVYQPDVGEWWDP